MFAQAKKRKVDAELRVFNNTWTSKYMFIEVKGRAVCLVCGEKVAVLKEYNLNRHYGTKHAEKYKNLIGNERARAADGLRAKLQNQQGFFTKIHSSREGAVMDQFCNISQNRKIQ